MTEANDEAEVCSVHRFVRYDIPRCDHEPCDNPEDGENITYGLYGYHDQTGQFGAGSWRSTAGTLNIRDLHIHEACFVMEGIVEVTDEHGEKKVFGPGDAFVLPAQFCGKWHMPAPFMKYSSHLVSDKKTHTKVQRIHRFQLQSRPLAAWVKPVGGDVSTNGQVFFEEETGQFTVGSWRCTAGSLAIKDLPVHESNVVVEGSIDVIDDKGRKTSFRTGDAFILPKGFSGTFEMPDPVMTFVSQMK